MSGQELDVWAATNSRTSIPVSGICSGTASDVGATVDCARHKRRPPTKVGRQRFRGSEFGCKAQDRLSLLP